jgi:hypothetical protein
LIWATAAIAVFSAAVLARATLGRTRPDLAVWFSFDDGPLTFSQGYASGKVGPFEIGDTRGKIIERLSEQHVLDQDVPQLSQNLPKWRVSLPTNAGGYVTYTITFTDDHATHIQTFYSLFSGL